MLAKMQESQSGHAVIIMGGMKSAGTSRMQCYTQVPGIAVHGIKEATSISALPEATQPYLSITTTLIIGKHGAPDSDG